MELGAFVGAGLVDGQTVLVVWSWWKSLVTCEAASGVDANMLYIVRLK
jgi:hypothetical protein